MSQASFVEYDPAPSMGSRMIVSAMRDRTSITFFAPAAGRVTLANSPVNGDGKGLVLAAGQAPLTLDAMEHGDAVRQNWYALYSGLGNPVSWVQTFT